MHGLVVGHVMDVRLSYDPVKDAIVAPVRYEVEPERILGLAQRRSSKHPRGCSRGGETGHAGQPAKLQA